MKREQSLAPSIPAGFRDILPAEAEQQREIESRMAAVFSLWGYGEVITPAVEYEAVVDPRGSRRDGELFNLFDRDGRRLALRPEMTPAVARVASSRMDQLPPPYRFYYVSDVFRQEEAQRGQRRQFRQAGVELIGEGNAYADAEVILLLCECLRAAGLTAFSVGLGQVEFLRAQLRALPVPDEVRRDLKKALAEHNLVAFEAQLRASVSGNDLIKKAMASLALRGGAEALDEARALSLDEQALEAVERLRLVFDIVGREGAGEHVLVDLGVIRRLDYYTGMIFEAYTPPLGFPIGGGGRYDNLLGAFGKPYHAAGFAVGIERLHIALEESGAPAAKQQPLCLVFDEEDPERAMTAAALVRRRGRKASGVLRPLEPKAAAALAERYGAEPARALEILEEQ